MLMLWRLLCWVLWIMIFFLFILCWCLGILMCVFLLRNFFVMLFCDWFIFFGVFLVIIFLLCILVFGLKLMILLVVYMVFLLCFMMMIVLFKLCKCCNDESKCWLFWWCRLIDGLLRIYIMLIKLDLICFVSWICCDLFFDNVGVVFFSER